MIFTKHAASCYLSFSWSVFNSMLSGLWHPIPILFLCSWLKKLISISDSSAELHIGISFCLLTSLEYFKDNLTHNIIWNEILDSHICSPSKGICLSSSFFCLVTCTTIYPLAEVRNLGFTPCYSFFLTSRVQSLSMSQICPWLSSPLTSF